MPRHLCLIALGVSFACAAQEANRDIDDHEAERQEWFYSQRRYPLARIPAGARINAIAATKRLEAAGRQQRLVRRAAPNAIDSDNWTLIGPRPTDGSATNTNASAGRINAIAIDPRDNDTVYIGAAEGGVWKTTDGGLNWTPLTDDQASLANGAIAIDPNAPDTVYVGTGEENFAQDSYYGAGILKSTDGGQTWTNFVGPFLRAVIGSIAIQPGHGKVLLCTTRSGIWRSTDGAANWSLVLPGVGTGVVFDPSDGNTAYVAVGNYVGSALNGLYKSTDGGLTWGPSNGSGANAIPSKNAGRISLAMSRSSSNILFASIHNVSTNRLLGIWKTTDGAQTWNQLPIPPSLMSSWGGQMWFDNVVAVSPKDPNVVWAGGTPIFRSLDGGNTWAPVPAVGSNGVRIHVDQHFFAFTDDGSKLYLGNDGGIYSTASVDSAAVNFTDLNSTLAITQFYPGFSVHPFDPNVSLGGAQDNSTQLYSGSLNWTTVGCGDGGQTAIDPSFPSIMYGSCQYISPNVSIGGIWVPASYGLDQTDRTQFIAPFVMDQSNPQTLYFGTYRVWRSADSGGRWSAVSPDLTLGKSTIKTIGVAPGDSNTIYVGTADSQIRVTRNALDPNGASWSKSATTGLPSRVVTRVAVDPIDATVAYAAFSGFASGSDTFGHVFKTTDAGATWSDISGNLPNIPVNDLLLDPDAAGALYVATDAGVMVSIDAGSSWNTLGNGLPRVVVHSLALQRANRILRAATHGRSVWQIGVPLQGPSAQPTIASIAPASADSGSDPFTIAVTGSNFGPHTRARWNGEDRETTFVDSSHLRMAIPAADVAMIGRAAVSLFSPDLGAGVSNSAAFQIGPGPTSRSEAAVSAAYPAGQNALGQRSIASLYGTALTARTLIADTPPLPFTLGGATLTLGNNPVPLFFVSPGQINFQAPFLSVSRPTQFPLVITQGLSSTTINVTVVPYAPAIFTMNSQGSGQAAAVIAGTASLAAPAGNYPSSRPIRKSEYLSLYCTGLGDVDFRPTLGSPSPSNPPANTLTKPVITLGGQQIDPSLVTFSGLAPGFVGLYQVNFQIPATAPSGDGVTLKLSIGATTSNLVTIAIE